MDLNVEKQKEKKSFPAAYRRIIVLWIDFSITVVAFFLAWLCFRRYMSLGASVLGIHLLTVIATTGVFFLLFRCHDSLWRYQESREYLMQFTTHLVHDGHAGISGAHDRQFDPGMLGLSPHLPFHTDITINKSEQPHAQQRQ